MYQDKPSRDKGPQPFSSTLFSGEAKVIELVQRLLDELLPESFGYYAATLGDLGAGLDFTHSPIKHWFYLTNQRRAETSCIVQYDALPIASDSLDMVLLPHILDFIEQPHDLLREVERVMIPDGKLVISGINPISWFGLRKLSAKLIGNPVMSRRLIGLSRIKDWLKLIGFEVEDYCGLEFIAQSEPQIWQPFASHFCSHYFIIARKSVSTLTPIRPSWRTNRKLVPARFAEPGVQRLVERELKKVQN